MHTQLLADKAQAAAQRAYAPYSNHAHGAAVLAGSARLYGGANIEIAGSTSSCCALRVAFARAIAAGERQFTAAAATGDMPGEKAALCGVCRQTLAEFCAPDTPVLLVGAGGTEETCAGALLPGWPFSPPDWAMGAEAGAGVASFSAPSPDQNSEARGLIGAAFEGRHRCYAPHSRYYVGAALQAASGRVYTGGNIETAGRTPVLCAERVALFCAVYMGERQFESLAVVGALRGTPPEEYAHANPCAVCRQALAEFNGGSLVCYLAKNPEDTLRMTLDELLPHAFRIGSYR